MNNTFKKVLACTLVAAMSMAVFAGCGKDKNAGLTEDGKVLLTIGQTPDPDAKPEKYKARMELISRFNDAHPDIQAEGDAYNFDVKTFSAKAEAGTLPIMGYVPMTEAKKIIDMGYAYDLTDVMKESGYYDILSDSVKNIVTKDGKVYLFPVSTYDTGLFMNVGLLEQAGYVDADGTPHQPETWEELAEMAAKIKEVTGKAGFIFPTMGNQGGWRSMAIFWSYGVDFMEQDKDGKWKATFNTPEAVAALQFIKDLKWKYDVLPSNTLIDGNEINKQIGLGEAAMAFAEPSTITSFYTYGLTKDDVAMVKMPAGPEGRYSLLGGSLQMVPANATEAQAKAALEWLRFTGSSAELTDDVKASIDTELERMKAENEVIGLMSVNPWNDGAAVVSYKEDLYTKECNVNMNHIKLYNDKTGITYKEEEPIDCQALYAILDACVQEVLNNKDADCAALIEKAAADFQSNNLDYAN